MTGYGLLELGFLLSSYIGDLAPVIYLLISKLKILIYKLIKRVGNNL
jgi:hypothetical protein